ncbi:DUF1801 domain-containing protein [Flaviaesturariibacter flavus]|uniref:DUF1801 domain-containing protein n=1 Tax=Flaviaesturariibacter flavus TaxID=2502780 RepID=A0A4V2NVM1_9BACT|nr:DUF1801 domain-containing protein [Flaviaesturariibacter flavus]TCJ13972.1 DUF1801 domain-containing protein [Flaviaesturariibacter flavus]
MTSTATTPQDYIASLPDDRKDAMSRLYETIAGNLPAGFSDCMASGMLYWVVPHSRYPAGYHCNPKQPLPFLAIASQKNFIAVYHMGLYSNPKLLEWFVSEYPKHSKTKLDMGKSCVRFKKPEAIPFELIGQLATKMTPDQWINAYEEALKR